MLAQASTGGHLLVAPLHGAVAFEQVHDVAVAVRQDLHLHVARVDDEPAAKTLPLLALCLVAVGPSLSDNRISRDISERPKVELYAPSVSSSEQGMRPHFSANMRPSPKDAFASLLALANASSSSSTAQRHALLRQ